jgi:ferredoxin
VKVHADRDVCIQAGNCVMTADSLFDQDDDGVVVVLIDDIADDDEDKAAEAVKLCPSQALTITQD